METAPSQAVSESESSFSETSEQKQVKKGAGAKNKEKKAQTNAKVKEAKKTKPAKAEGAGGETKGNFLTPARVGRLKEILEEIKGWGNQQLKDVLRKNNQSMSGAKTELLGKVADGILFGRIPKCPTCHGGRLRFELATGQYHCSGYYEDMAFFQCDAVFEFSQIKRDPWTK